MKFHWQFVGCFGLIWLQAAVVIAQPFSSSLAGETMTFVTGQEDALRLGDPVPEYSAVILPLQHPPALPL